MVMHPGFYHFGPFQVDVVRRVLLREGQPAQLSPKVFDTLMELIARGGEVVSKEELLAAVWPDAAVEENSLARSISTLRKVLGESASDHRYVVTVPGRGYSFVAAVRQSGYPDSKPAAQPPTPPMAEPPRQLYWKVVWGTLLVTAAATAISILGFREPGGPSFEDTKTTKITSSGRSVKAVLSPDGRYIAHTVMTGGEQSMLLRRTTTLHDIEILPPAPVRYVGFTFSPDNENLYYVAQNRGPGAPVLYRMPVLGGSSQKLKENLDSPVTFSPDGKQFAFVRESTHESTLIVSDLASGAERKIISRKLPRELDYPAWSPDGGVIAYTDSDSSVASPRGSDARIFEVGVADGRERPLSSQIWGFIRQIAWLGQRRGWILSARDTDSAAYHLWIVPHSGGAGRKLTDGVDYQNGVSVSVGSRQIVTVEEHRFSAIARLDPIRGQNPEPVLAEVTGWSPPVWMPNGRILFEQDLNGTRGLWTVDPDGRNQKQLTLPGNNYDPSISLAGRLACTSDRSGTSAIWTMDMEGGNPAMVAKILGGTNPKISPDGKWVAFTAPAAGHWPTLWRARSSGGPPVELNDKLWAMPVVSPDGKWIAGFYADRQLNTQKYPTHIAVIGIGGGRPSTLFPIPPSVSYWAGIRWAAGGRELSYVASGKDGDNIWSQPFSGGAPRQVTRFQGGQTLFRFDWSPDGRQLVFSRGVQARDVVMLRDLRHE